MFLGNLLVLGVVVIIQGIVIFGKLPGFKPHFIKSLPERKEIYHFGFWSWLQTIISVIAYQMDRFLIAYFLGTATVTYYVLASTIANHLHMAFVAAVSWLLPKISRLKAALEDTRTYFHTIRAFSVGFSLLVIAALYFVSEPLFTLWLGPEKYLKMIFFFKLFLVFEAFLILSIVPNLYLNAIKSLSFSTSLELMYKSAIILSMVVFFSYWKTADSLIWGQIIALIVFMPAEYFLINKRILKENSLKETILTMLPSIFIGGSILAYNWIWSIVFFTLGLLFYYFIYLKDRHFKRSLLTE
jgi:O-antigen/teichoic acid export membrane protein